MLVVIKLHNELNRIFFRNQLLKKKQKNNFGILTKCQTIWSQIIPDILLGPGQRMLVALFCFQILRLSVCLSNGLSVVTLTFFIGFHPNFIYGLLPSNSHLSANMGFVGQKIKKMGDKMATTCRFALVDTLT